MKIYMGNTEIRKVYVGVDFLGLLASFNGTACRSEVDEDNQTLNLSCVKVDEDNHVIQTFDSVYDEENEILIL